MTKSKLAILFALIFVGCAGKVPIPIPSMSEALGDLSKYGCTCNVGPEEAKHLIIIGDELMRQILGDLIECRETPVAPQPNNDRFIMR